MSGTSEPDVLIAQKSSIVTRIRKASLFRLCLGEIRSVQEMATAYCVRGSVSIAEYQWRLFTRRLTYIVVRTEREDNLRMHIATLQTAIDSIIDSSKCRCQNVIQGQNLPHAVRIDPPQ
jgi:hypothetical protein